MNGVDASARSTPVQCELLSGTGGTLVRGIPDLPFFGSTALNSNKSHTGAFTYDTAAVATVPLQKLISQSELANLTALLDSSLSRKGNTPLQKAQYGILKRFLAKGEVGWMEFMLLAGGGAASLPQGNTSYITPFAFHLWPLSRGSVVRKPLVVQGRPLINCFHQHISSKDPAAALAIDPGYLTDPFGRYILSMMNWIDLTSRK